MAFGATYFQEEAAGSVLGSISNKFYKLSQKCLLAQSGCCIRIYILNIPTYACGLKPGPAYILNQNPFFEYEIIRNGDFEAGNNSWITRHLKGIASFGAKDGEVGLQLEHHNHAIQFLPIPTEIHSATIRFDYQTKWLYCEEENPGTLAVYLGTSPVPESDNFEKEYNIEILGEHLFSQIIDKSFFETHYVEDPEKKNTTKWLEFELQLNQTHLMDMQTARKNGKMVFLVISHIANDTSKDGSYLNNIDNGMSPESHLAKNSSHPAFNGRPWKTIDSSILNGVAPRVVRYVMPWREERRRSLWMAR